MTHRRSRFSRRYWFFPEFSPEKLGEYQSLVVRVAYWVRLDNFIVSLLVPSVSFANQRWDGPMLASRLKAGFESAPRPFVMRHAVICESTASLFMENRPGMLDGFKRKEPLLFKSVRNPEITRRFDEYEFSKLESPKPDPDDLPF